MEGGRMREKRVKAFFLTVPLLVLTVFFSPPKKVWGDDLFVKEGGSGTSCTRAFPCNFAYAIDTKAAAGDRIFFKHGTYKGTASSVVRITKELKLYGGWNGFAFGDLVINPELYPSILDGEGVRPVVVILGPIKALVSTFTIQNGNAQNLPAQTIICQGEMTTGCGGGIYVGEAEALIASNKILSNQANGEKGWGGGVHLESASGTILMNNLIQENQSKFGGGLSIFGSTVTSPKILQNNRFINNNAMIAGGGIFFESETNPTIQDSLFETNTAGGGGSSLFGTGSADIIHNLLQNHTFGALVYLQLFTGRIEANQMVNNNVSNGLVIINGADPLGIPFMSTYITNNVIARSGLMKAFVLIGGLFNPVVEHNTLVGESIGSAMMIKTSSALGLNNNLISGYPVGIDATESTGVVIARHTLFDSSVTTQGINVTMVNPLVGDPAFKDPAANDFHIRMTSAARDAGTANFMTTNQDMDGEPRPMGSAPDIGADEFNPSLLNWLYLPLINR
jgi:hypothetical protein